MIITQANKLERSFGATTLFKDVSFDIQEKSRIGLVGPNGVGKTTLIKMLTKQEPPTSGEVSYNKNISVGFIAQENNLNEKLTVFAAMAEVFKDLQEAEQELNDLQLKLAESSTPSPELLKKYDQLQFSFQANGGFTYQAEIKRILNGFKFDESTYDKKISVLSGGEKTRLSFVKLLLKNPDLLILDEPTNHLDLDTLTWLEGFLNNYPGAILTISHDQYFLDAIATEILELNHGRLRHFPGNYSHYVSVRDELAAQQEVAFEKQQAEIKRQEEFIQKNIVRASTTKRAQSRQKQLDKMELLSRPDHNQKVRINFKFEQNSGNEVLNLTNLTVGYPDKPMVKDLNLQIRKKDKIGIIGPNGIGKSTLLKTIVKELPIQAGEIKYGANLKIGYYDQEINHLDLKKTVLDTVWDRHKMMPEREVRGVLASFLFHADDLQKTVGQLSGGQRARLALTVLSLEDNNFLIFDEPTNHLDIDAKEVLEDALTRYEGTVLFVSHDRYFINQLAQKIVAVDQQHATIYDGNYSYYLEKSQQFTATAVNDNTTVSDNASAGKNNYQQQKQQQSKQRKLERRVTDLEEKIDQTQQKIEQLNLAMAEPEVAVDFAKIEPLQREITELTNAMETLTSEWEEALLELEELK